MVGVVDADGSTDVVEPLGSKRAPTAGGIDWWRVIMVIAVLAGIGIRIWSLTHYSGALDSDEAVVGLMAKRMVQDHFAVFYWGQAYGGTLEVAITAALFAVFGPSTVLLKLVPFGLHAVAALLVWRVGRRTIEEPAATVAALLIWLWPAAFVWMSIKAYGFYGVTLVAALGILLLVLRLREQSRGRDWVMLGLAVGFGWWCTPEIVFVAAPAVLWLGIRNTKALRNLFVAAPAALLGASPWIMWNLRNHFASLKPTPQPIPGNTYTSHLAGFVREAFPGALSTRVPLTAEWFGSPLIGRLTFLGLGLFLVAIALRYRRGLELPICVGLLYPFIFAMSGYSWYVAMPRYLLLLSPVIALVFARGLVRTPLGAFLGLCCAASMTIVGLKALPSGLPFPQSFAPLEAALEGHQIDRAFGDYWIAYRVTFETKEAVVMSPLSPVRYIPYDTEVRQSPDPAYVFLAGSLPDYQFTNQLKGLFITYRVFSVPGFSIYVPSEKLVPPLPGASPGPVTLAANVNG